VIEGRREKHTKNEPTTFWSDADERQCWRW